MCVIYACATTLPSKEELARGAFKNDDGAGIAWLNKKKQRVHWKKGLKDEDDVLAYIQDNKLDFPLAIHYRTASAGGAIPALCHPFPVCEDVPLWLEGYAPEVLMHNGHMGKWEELVLQAGFANQVKFPEGPWSDTRAMAWLTHLKGPGVLRFIHDSSRVLLFSALDEKTEGLGAWDYFSFWGNWQGKHEDGFIQSITTEYYNRGGVVHYSRGAAAAADDDDDDTKGNTSGVSCSSTVKNVWSISELSEILEKMEKELADARTAAGV